MSHPGHEKLWFYCNDTTQERQAKQDSVGETGNQKTKKGQLTFTICGGGGCCVSTLHTVR